MTMRLRGERGEGVMLVLMGAMIAGGIILWLATGDFHMMPTHGMKHEKTGTVPTNKDFIFYGGFFCFQGKTFATRRVGKGRR